MITGMPVPVSVSWFEAAQSGRQYGRNPVKSRQDGGVVGVRLRRHIRDVFDSVRKTSGEKRVVGCTTATYQSFQVRRSHRQRDAIGLNRTHKRYNWACMHGRGQTRGKSGAWVLTQTNDGERCRPWALLLPWPRGLPALSLQAGLCGPPLLSPRRWSPWHRVSLGAGAKCHGKASQSRSRDAAARGHARGLRVCAAMKAQA